MNGQGKQRLCKIGHDAGVYDRSASSGSNIISYLLPADGFFVLDAICTENIVVPGENYFLQIIFFFIKPTKNIYKELNIPIIEIPQNSYCHCDLCQKSIAIHIY